MSCRRLPSPTLLPPCRTYRTSSGNDVNPPQGNRDDKRNGMNPSGHMQHLWLLCFGLWRFNGHRFAARHNAGHRAQEIIAIIRSRCLQKFRFVNLIFRSQFSAVSASKFVDKMQITFTGVTMLPSNSDKCNVHNAIPAT